MKKAMKDKCEDCDEYRFRTAVGGCWTGFYTCSCGTISVHEGRHEDYGSGFVWIKVEGDDE